MVQNTKDRVIFNTQVENGTAVRPEDLSQEEPKAQNNVDRAFYVPEQDVQVEEPVLMRSPPMSPEP